MFPGLPQSDKSLIPFPGFPVPSKAVRAFPDFRSVVITKTVPFTAVWNAGDVNASITLTNSDRTMGATTTAWKAGRGFSEKSTGKWYFEIKIELGASTYNMGGILDPSVSLATHIGAHSTGWAYNTTDGKKWNNNVQTAYGLQIVAGGILGVAVDLDDGKIWWARDGAWQGAGDPAAGAFAAFTNVAGPVLPAGSPYSSGNELTIAADEVYCIYDPPTGYAYWQ